VSPEAIYIKLISLYWITAMFYRCWTG